AAGPVESAVPRGPARVRLGDAGEPQAARGARRGERPPPELHAQGRPARADGAGRPRGAGEPAPLERSTHVAIVGLRYDLRSAPFAATTHPELYAACLDQSAWAEERDVAQLVSLSEHHGMEDGFLPSPFTMAAAIAARTSKLPITIAAALFPLHDPIRLAEQIAIADLIARGRISIVAGAGYAVHEFEMAGIDRKQRGRLLEESIEVMRKAWTGEPFEYRGRTIRVTPTPFTKPHPMILLGGSSEAA